MKVESHIKFLLVLLYIYLAWRFVPTLLVWFTPFILAYLVAASTRPLATFMTKKWKVRPKVSAAISLAINLVFIFSIIGAIIARIIVEIISNSGYVIDFVKNTMAYLQTFGITEELTSWLVNGLQWAVNSITSFAFSIPEALVFFFVFLLASIFLSLDYENIRDSILLQLPEKHRARMHQIKKHTVEATFRYICGVAILLLIDFVVLILGFLILRVNYAFALAILLTILDLLPIIGPAIVMIPWGVISCINGQIPLGVGIIVIYIVMTLLRELSEPKVMSKSMNLHPFVMILSIYIGYKVFGMMGLIFFPIATLVLVSLQRSGAIRFWRTKEDQDLYFKD